MIPRTLQRLLFGRGGSVRKRRAPALAVHYPQSVIDVAQQDPRARRDYSQGEFRVVDETPGQPRGVVLQPIDADAAAAALAAERARLTAAGPAAAAPTDDDAYG
jgi:hypothetical protein